MPFHVTMPPKVPSFGSQSYWDQRFTKHTAPFDWLSAPTALDPFITEALRTLHEAEPQILHIGCGSSLLSQHLKTHVRRARQVHNVDYSEVVINTEKRRETEQNPRTEDVTASMRWDAVDLLDCSSLLAACSPGAYAVIVDKSTGDAIACADDVVCPLPYAVSTRQHAATERVVAKEVPVHPLHVVAVHLALVTKPGAKWISLSYSSERYSLLEGKANGTTNTGVPDPRLLWTVVGKHHMEAKEQEDGGASGLTHRPKVYHWVYILQRTSAPLFVHNG